MKEKQNNITVSEKEFKRLRECESYRIPMEVDELRVFRSCSGVYDGYYVCSRCKITIEREFMSYCDRCGQKLNWKNYKKAKRVYFDARN